MAHEQQFIDTINEIRANPSAQKVSFAEIIAKVWGGKVVEVYVGDTYEDIKLDDSTQKYAAIVIGKVITAYAEMLVLNCAYIDPVSKKMQFGNIVCLNERGIRTITEVDDSGILRDTFLSSRDGRIVKELLNG